MRKPSVKRIIEQIEAAKPDLQRNGSLCECWRGQHNRAPRWVLSYRRDDGKSRQIYVGTDPGCRVIAENLLRAIQEPAKVQRALKKEQERQKKLRFDLRRQLRRAFSMRFPGLTMKGSEIRPAAAI